MSQPEPGTAEAVALGGICQPRDGEIEDNLTWPEWLIEGCPVHDRLGENMPMEASES